MSHERGSSYVERTIQHVLQALLVIGIVAIFVSLSKLDKNQAVAVEKMNSLQVQLVNMKELTNDRYTGTDATRDFNIVTAITADHETRLRKVEREHSLIPKLREQKLKKTPLYFKWQNPPDYDLESAAK